MKKNSNFKKKNAILLSLSIIATMCVVLFSCSKRENTSQPVTPLKVTTKLNNNGRIKLGPLTAIETSSWEDQISFIKNVQNILSKNGIQLTSFQLTGELTSVQDVDLIKSKILSEQSIIPISEGINIYTIKAISEVLRSDLTEKRLFSGSVLKKNLDSLIKPGMETLSFKWLYKGLAFSSICVVKKGGSIVYENLISNVSTFSVENNKENTDFSAFNANIARSLSSEPETGGGPTAISYSWGSAHYTYTNFFGTQKAEAYVVLSVTGTRSSSGTKTITGNSATGYHTAEPGYSAAAVVSVTPHPNNGTLQFAYGVAVSGSTATLTFSWSGSGFSMPSTPGVTGQVGTFSIYPANLN